MGTNSLICDFCGDNRVTWSYPAQNCSLPHPAEVGVSVGAWAACDGCHDLIERGNRRALAERCAGGYDHTALPIPKPELIEIAMDVHKMFFKHRNGPAKRFYGVD